MAKSILTNYDNISAISGRSAECIHHLIGGVGVRPLSDADGLVIPLTNAEHNLSPKGTVNQIHGNPIAESLSKMLGEVAWERQYLADKLAGFPSGMYADGWIEEAREMFRKRYHRNYL